MSIFNHNYVPTDFFKIKRLPETTQKSVSAALSTAADFTPFTSNVSNLSQLSFFKSQNDVVTVHLAITLAMIFSAKQPLTQSPNFMI